MEILLKAAAEGGNVNPEKVKEILMGGATAPPTEETVTVETGVPPTEEVNGM